MNDRMHKWFVTDDGETIGFPTRDQARAYAQDRIAEYNLTNDKRAEWLYWGRIAQDVVIENGTYRLKDVR